MTTEKTKVVPQRLSREAYHALEVIVGKEWVTEDRAMIEAYVVTPMDTGGIIAVATRNPRVRSAAIVLPASTEEVQAIVRAANRYGFPINPVANMMWQTTPTVPGTVAVSPLRMNKILQIDEKNMSMTIQPFVNYGMIHHEATKRGLWLGGSGWHGAIAKPCSQFTSAGLWQSDLKYTGLARNTLGLKMVMPDGRLLRLGSSAIAGTRGIPFTERFPGPNLMGFIKGSFGGRGIITEITLKLHPWVGGYPFPEDRGRPSIEHYFEEAEEKKFDRPPIMIRHKIFWFEYRDLESLTEGMANLARSGIGIALNSGGQYWALMCSYSLAQADMEVRDRRWGLSGYMILAGISSEKQLAYEERVLRHIVEETGGKLWSEEYKPELLDGVAPWNIEFAVNTETGMRTVRSNYVFTAFVPPGDFRPQIPMGPKWWQDTLKETGACGAAKGDVWTTDTSTITPYVYILDRGHQLLTEVDQYPTRSSVKECITTAQSQLYNFYDMLRKNYPGSYMGTEHINSMTPEAGPDRYLLLRKYAEATDPKGVMVPGRLILTGDAFKAMMKEPSPSIRTIMRFREKHGFPAKPELAPEGDRWKPTE